MANHNPNITSSAATTSFSENSNTTNSSAAHIVTGTMNFTDSDKNDSHTTSASLKSAVLSAGSVIPSASLAHLNSAMSSVIQNDNNGSGKLKWTFNAADYDFDFLAKNQKLTLTYEIKLNDNHGGTTKKTVTVTITGTDDKPVIDFGVEAIVNEQANQSLSLSLDSANIAVHFVDPDLTNTGHTATVTGVSASGATGGLLPGFLGQLELLSFFHINNVVKTSGSSNGTINTRFSAPDLAFDYLSDGETLDITYTIQLNDNAGLSSTQTVVVTVIGSNDGPYIIGGPDTEHLTEGEDLSPAGDLTASGDFHFADIDLSDTHTVSTTVTAVRSGGGVVPISNADLVAAMSTSLDDSTGHIFGEVDWAFALDNDDVSFLNSGETLTLTYTITVSDGAGGSDTQIITVTILGTNDPVVVTSGPQSASLAEFADTTGSAALNTTTPVPTGTIAFTDTDLGDTHTVMVSVASAVWSGGPAVPSGTDADLPTALLTTLNDSTGTGTGGVDWSFSIEDQDLDFLALGETLTVQYTVAVSDGPTTSSQIVTITVDGANDATAITSGPGAAAVEEFANTTGSSDPNSTSPVPTGTISFTDVDLSDVHTVSVFASSFVWSTGSEIPGDSQFNLANALLTTLNDSTGSGSGSVDWTFSVADSNLDFLAAGDTLTITYEVTVSDGATSATQIVAITVTGTEDPLTVNPVTVAVTDTFSQDTGQLLASGNVITDVMDSGGDAGTTLSVTDVNGSAANVGQFISGVYGDLLISEEGIYIYIANSNVDPLQVGDTPSEQFTFTVTDSIGRSETTTLTFNIAGENDAPVITAAEASGTMTEDAGPSQIVNGGFETGDLTGWSASDSDIGVEFVALGGQFGDYSAKLAPGSATLSQNVTTTPGQHYIVTFYVSGDAESSNNQFTASWNGVTLLTLNDQFGGLTAYTFDVISNASDPTTLLQFSYFDDGIGMYLDGVTVEAASGPPTETADGTISFADIETVDTHTASFVPQSGDYVGTFSLGAITESSGSGSLDWHFTVDNADIQFLAAGETLTQTYTVFVTDDHGASVPQDVTITINGANDAPTAAVDDTIITNAGEDGGLFIPAWTFGLNDLDPDTADVLTLNSILSSTGGSAFVFGGPLFFDDSTLGGSFTYDVTDGTVVGPVGTATVVNHSASVTALIGTSGDDIIIASTGVPTPPGGVALDGGDGNDILIGNFGDHELTGGDGDDIFAFEVVPDGTNTITDFENTTDSDMIAISSSAFGSGLAAGMDVSTVFESSGDAEFLGGLFHYDTSSQILYFSSDGTTASAIAIVQLQPGVLLSANDLFIT